MPVLYSLTMALAWKSLCVLAAAWVIARLIRTKSAAIRHLVWSLAFASLLTLPLFSVLLPTLGVSVGSHWQPSGLLFKTQALSSIELQARETKIQDSSTPRFGTMLDWQLWLLLIWTAGIGLSLARMLMGWMAVRRLRSTARPLVLPELAVDIALLETNAGTMPMTYGFFRPVIFIPENAREWSDDRKRLVLRHEMAHIRRCDAGTQLMARVALSLYWWNPLAWMGWREFLKDRERAADDLVLSQGESNTEYAGHLLDIARGMQLTGTEWPVVAMASTSQLEGRLAAILDSERDRRAPRQNLLIVASIAAIGFIAPLAAMQAKSSNPILNSSQMGQFAGDRRTSELMASADQARDGGKFEQAKASYTEALNLSPTLGIAYLHRGTAELGLKDYAGAMADFEKAGSVDSGFAGNSKMWMAITQQQQGNSSVADALYQSAIATGEPQSAQTATAMELHAQFLEKQGKLDEAKSMREKALDVRKALAPNPPSVEEAEAYRVGGDIQPPALLSKVEPSYSEEARLAHYSGTILLTTVIGEDGSAISVRVVRGLGLGLSEKAVEAVRQWKFKPGSKDGNAVRVKAAIEVSFRLL